MAEVSGVQHLRRRSVASQLNLFVGSSGELMADMSNMRTSLSDGVTAGGWPSQKATEFAFKAGATRNVLGSDAVIIGVSNSGSGNITINLPSAKNYPFGQKLVIADAGNNLGTNAINVNSISSTEKLIGLNNGTIQNSTTIGVPIGGNGLIFTPISTNATWVFWF